MSTARRDTLLAIERATQAEWERNKLNCWDAPAAGEARRPKFFTTFPFPYMNGLLHLGHGFSLTKAEFASRYQRMQNKQSLWAFGFHATGMPIAACAQKIKKEMELYGNPPVFPDDEPVEVPSESKSMPGPNNFKSKRGKSGPAKPQWLIMQSLQVPDDKIAQFADPRHWLSYFPPLAIEDLKLFGCHIDFRRSFITTDINPFFDRFISWQFRKLREANLINFDKRYCVYSPWDGQPCADHDRAAGEGVQPQEYTLVKLVVQDALSQEVFSRHANIIGSRRVILPGATLRTETVIGQTNCWVSPTITYGAYAVKNKSGEEDIFIMTPRAARNMAYQNFVVNGATGVDPQALFTVEGAKMLGLPLSAFLCPYKTIYTLPMHTITEAKGTGIVMCVPSDSPDDYINYSQLQNKPEYRAMLGIKDEWIMPFDVVPILDIPGLTTLSAKYMCEKLKINGPNARDLLEEAKKTCYQDGFYKGVMIAGPFTGKRVPEAKVLMLKMMLEKDECVTYYEPMAQVMSRSGDECIVALCDQWYLEYGKEEWKAAVRAHLSKMNMHAQGVLNGFEESLNWLSDWPCSRTFGLGTYLPCDATHTMIIDSLSDSTIYMAYYTITPFIHNTTKGELVLEGTEDNAYGLKAEMFTDAVFDHIFHGKGEAASVAESVGMPVDSLQMMRNEFEYWYPVDLRCSGKDLIQNHLTMFLYNHAAIWPDEPHLWPRSIFCNGHIQVDGEKMSKSKGNFISLREALATYGADATRLTCADSGDSLDDGNFVRDTAAMFILKLTTVIDQATELLRRSELRAGEYNKFDLIAINNINTIITRAETYYNNMQFRMVLNIGFYELVNEFSQYKLNCDDEQVHSEVTHRFYEVLSLLMMPLAPHFAEHMWQVVLGNTGYVVNQPFPKPTAPLDYSLVIANRIMMNVVKEIRSQKAKLAKKRGTIDHVVVYTAAAFSEWQLKALEVLNRIYENNENTFPADLTKQIMASKPDWLTKELLPETLAFISYVRGNVESYGTQALSARPIVDDYDVLSKVTHNLSKLADVKLIEVLASDDTTYSEHKVARRKCRPGEPTIAFIPEKK